MTEGGARSDLLRAEDGAVGCCLVVKQAEGLLDLKSQFPLSELDST